MSKLLRDDVDRFFDYNVHVPTRTLFLGPEVDEEMAELAIKGLALLGTVDLPISILMNNLGGDEYHGLAIYDAIALTKSHVTITVYGHAMSMGSWILQAGDDRVLAPNATVLLHYGTWGEHDNYKQFRALAKEGERLRLLMETSYLRRLREKDPKFPAKRLVRMLEDETYLTSEAAVELGLADRVLT
jgi:ATP-dependent Clp protease protease subunit